MTAGLSATGLEIKSTEQILAEVEADERALSGAADLDTSSESPIGQLNASFVPRVRELWELLAAVHAARDPRNAAYASLDALAAITGTTRQDATKGRVVLTLTLSGGATVPAGSIAQVSGQPGNRWVTTETATNTGSWQDTFDVAAEGAVAGRYVANSGSITVIATPVSGWISVTNAADATEGAELERDPALRVRREAELSRPGTATVPAIRTDLLGMRDADDEPVLLSANVEENTSDFPDALGRPPHTVEAIVQFPGGLSLDELAAARQAVANQLWASKPGGIGLVGDHVGTSVDAIGVARVVRWSEPTLVPIYVAVTLRRDRTAYAGDDAVIAAVLAYGATLRLGQAVVRSKILCVALDVAGVLDVTAVTLGTDPDVLRALNVPIGPRELATFDSANVAITVTT